MSNELQRCPTLPDVIVYDFFINSIFDSVTRALIHTLTPSVNVKEV
ncbi:hypothetical protein [Colwellia psychrerythraea]|nr:hypothetical protein [Colwellia psychrerythraea]